MSLQKREDPYPQGALSNVEAPIDAPGDLQPGPASPQQIIQPSEPTIKKETTTEPKKKVSLLEKQNSQTEDKAAKKKKKVVPDTNK